MIELENDLVVVEFADEVGGVYFRSVLIKKAGARIPQHIHDYDHATYCGRGSAAMLVDGIHTRDVKEGEAVLVVAGKEHAFQALEDNTRLTCMHDAASALSMKQKGI